MGTKVRSSEMCTLKSNNSYECWSGTFYEKLEANADSNNIVILAVVDLAFVDMAINLFEGLEHLQIKNFIFICSDTESFNILLKKNINAFLYDVDIDSKNPSDFGTEMFRNKVGIKLKIVTAAVMLGFDVLLTDIDVVFLKDPIPNLLQDNGSDLYIQDDVVSPNSGFY